MQQPAGHDVASQTHTPVLLLHSSPEEHAAHAAPPVPQEVFDSDAYGSQLLPLQQPAGHDVASQTHEPVVLLHSWPDAQAAHAAPLAPQEVFDSLDRASQVPALQQPVQDAPLQLQTPLVHESPPAHAAQLAPLVPHCDVDCDV